MESLPLRMWVGSIEDVGGVIAIGDVDGVIAIEDVGGVTAIEDVSRVLNPWEHVLQGVPC